MKYFLVIAILHGVMTALAQAVETRMMLPSKETVPDGNQIRIRELEDSLASADDRKSFDLRFELFGQYLGTEPEKAMAHLDKCIELANRTGDSLLIVKTGNARGTVMRNHGELKGAIEIYEDALKIARRNNYSDQVIYLLNNLALAHTTAASFDGALKYNLESLRIREMKGDPTTISIALNNLGIVYYEMKDYENALRYFEASYNIKIKDHVRHDLERSLVNIGLALINLGKYDQAELKISEAFVICQTTVCRPDILLEAYFALGRVHLNRSKYRISEGYFLKSLSLSQTLALSNYCAVNYYWLAELKFLDGSLHEALKYLEQSERIAYKAEYQNIMLDNYLLYAKIYKKQKDFSRAFDFQSRHNELKAEILNGNLIRKISQIERDFSERENNIKIATQSKIMDLQKDSIEQHKRLNISLGAVVFMTLVLVVVLLKLNRRKEEINNMLDQRVKDRTIELQRSSETLSHSYQEQAIVMKKIQADLLAIRATFKGLSNNASRDLGPLDATYFKQAEITIESILGYVSRH